VKIVISLYYNSTWRTVQIIYTGSLDNLSLIYEFYNLVLVDCQLILKAVVSPEYKSSLLVKHCVVCFIPRNRRKKF
jgi:hypothetical protein